MSIQTLNQLKAKFKLAELPREAWFRSVQIPCPECEGKKKNCDWCGGTGEDDIRSENVNALRKFEGEHPQGFWITITEYPGFGSEPWLSVQLRDSKFEMQGIEKRFRPNGKVLATATSTSWTGQQAGSAIQRLPESIRRKMWRTFSKDSVRGDSHVQPTCIIAYMIEQLS